MQEVRVLLLSANPAGTARLHLDEEIREITNKIRASDHRQSLRLISCLAARPDDFQQALLEHRPHIVHFSGHGTKAGELLVLNRNGDPTPIDKDALVWLFGTLKDNVRVVLLNACYSQPQAEAIAGTVECTIGMKKGVGDRAAIVFAGAFYRAIGFGRSVREAFNLGKGALLLEGIPEVDTPELWTHSGVDASGIVLLKPLERGSAEPGPREPPILILTNYQIEDESGLDRLRYRSHDDQGCLFVEPDDVYLDTVRSGGVIQPLYYAWSPWQWRLTFPTLDIKVVNNTDRTLFFHEVLFRVKRSRPDPTPLPVIHGDGCYMTLSLQNVGWGVMQDCVLRFSLNGRFEDPAQCDFQRVPFELPIGDVFEEREPLQLSCFFEAAGVDLLLLTTLATQIGRDREWVYFPADSTLGGTFEDAGAAATVPGKKRMSVKEYDDLLAKALGPFPDGTATLVGKLDYWQTDVTGRKARHTVGVMAMVAIRGPGLGLPAPPSYSYNVRFEVQGENYTRRIPISQWLSPGTVDRFLISIAADKSSVHEFDIVLRYNDTEQIVSRPVSLTLFLPQGDANGVSERASGVAPLAR